MRRSRYTGFYKTFEPKRGSLAKQPQSPNVVSAETWVETHRENCKHWRPTGEYVRIVDGKQREWLVHDTTAIDGFAYERRFGAEDAFVRIFYNPDHVRARYLNEPDDRTRDPAKVRRQLRFTFRVDFPEQLIRSSGEAIQDLYDSRRGMGRR